MHVLIENCEENTFRSQAKVRKTRCSIQGKGTKTSLQIRKENLGVIEGRRSEERIKDIQGLQYVLFVYRSL